MIEALEEDLSYCLHGRIACLELMYKATISMMHAFTSVGGIKKAIHATLIQTV